MPLYTFRCPDGHEFDKLASRETQQVVCPCSATADRLEVYSFGVSGFASTPGEQRDYRDDFRRYQEASQSLQYQKERLEDSAQQRFADPPIAQMARQEAKKLEKAGVTADQIST